MHLSRLNAPNNWKIIRKQNKWIVKPMPGAHPLKRCIPVCVIMRDMLGYADTSREVKRVIGSKGLLVNNVPVKNHRLPVGVMDVVEIKELGEFYLVLLDENNHFILKKIKKEQAGQKVSKITGRTCIKGGKTQVGFYDGTTLLLESKKDDQYSIGDSIVFNLETRKPVKHLKLEKGAVVYLTSGKHVGKKGIVDSIIRKGMHKDLIVIDIKGSKTQTLKEYAFVIEDKTI
jgi:small subunit ribosomal protein S4e